ncbi:MAG TPA: Uma2 family endonuclease, partial [Thermoanaerobaculia bacterium]|nr:Uma2 family endonuclease [Thermoanaerobaculia bacterium]
IIEVTSESTRKQDLVKRDRYQRLGVEEYFLFDPLGDYLHPRLQGYRLQGGRYQPLKPAAPDGSLESQTTGLTLQIEGERLRLIDTATGEKVLWADEQSAELKRTKEQVLREAEARRAAEEEVARERERADREAEARRTLEEELARLRQEMERRES